MNVNSKREETAGVGLFVFPKEGEGKGQSGGHKHWPARQSACAVSTENITHEQSA